MSFNDSNEKAGLQFENLSFQARGEASNAPQTTVLSCGGMYYPRRFLPTQTLTWADIVRLPGPDLSQKLFCLEPIRYDPIELTFCDYVAH